MKMIAKLIGLFFFLSLLSACGGGGNGASFTSGGDDGGGSTGGSTVSSIQLLTSNSQLESAGTSTVTLTAVLKDTNNNVISNIPVVFSANNNGSLQIIRGTTDSTGTAQATLSTAGDKTIRTITATATAGSISATVDVDVTGTTISVNGPTALGFAESGVLTFTLKDSAGTGISGKALTLTSNPGVNLSTNSVTTGVNGQATVTVTGVSDPGIVTVAGAGATSVHNITVSADSFTFSSPAANTEVTLGTPQEVKVRLLNGGVGVDGTTVNFTATRGTLTASSAVTAGGGFATVSVSSTIAGSSTIAATTGSGLTTQLSLLFVATTPATMTLQADPATLGINPSGSPATQTSTIKATVRDAANNLVKNKTVNFNVVAGGGTISPGSAVTDASGQATAVYTAGPSSSGKDGVAVKASIAGAICSPSVSVCETTATLTVAQQSLFITLGTGNTITEPDPTFYSYPYSVLVTDAAGVGKAGVTVTLTVIPTHYYKGQLRWSGTVWSREAGAVKCANEDLNFDGIFQPSDDDNNANGKLEPGNIAATAQSVVTDSNGFGVFFISYAQDHAYWVRVNLTAQAGVAGSEATNSAYFDLPGNADDYKTEAVAPPGQFSPYGTSLDCTNTD